MDNDQINDFLKKTRETVDYLDSRGKHELALQVLRTGSVMAEFALQVAGIPRLPKIKCGCGLWMKTTDEIIAFKHLGECLSCDHMRGELEYGDYVESSLEE